MPFRLRSDTDAASRRIPAWLLPTVALFVALIAYPLSTGPVLLLMSWMVYYDLLSGEMAGSIVRTLYGPLNWLCNQADWLAALLDWYILFW